MSRARMITTAALLTLFALACAREGGTVSETATDDSPVVARIDGAAITQNELDDWIKEQIFEQQVTSKSSSEQYEVRSRALDELVGQRVLAADAARRNLTPDEVIEQAVAAKGPISDQEVSDFFDKHKDRFRPPNNTLESRSAQIRSFLESERRQTARSEITDAADVEIALEAPRYQIADDGPSRGPDGAPVTIVEFSDYQCPYCVRAEPIIAKVLERYPEKVRLVYRHLPLDSIHPNARPAAEAAVCAEEQGRFWEYSAMLFANQRALSAEDLLGYATELELDGDAFTACLAKPEVKARVQGDVDAARGAGVSGTPAFFVNGILLSGAKPEGDFVKVIEAELDKLGSSEEAS